MKDDRYSFIVQVNNILQKISVWNMGRGSWWTV